MGFSAGLGFLVDTDGNDTNDGKAVTLKKGSNITLSLTGSTLTISSTGGGGGSAITVQNESSDLTTAATTLNFTGESVTATNDGSNAAIKNITINPRTVTAGGNTLGDSETLAFTAGTGISISESGGAVTITNSVTDSNTFRTIKVDTDNDGTANETIGSSEDLELVGGTNVTLAESGGKVTITATDTNTQLTLLDEDNFASDSATAAASQQSIKAYVDSVAQGLSVKTAVAMATTSNLVGTYDNSAGTFTMSSTGGVTIDGESATIGKRVLIKDQVSAEANGIYTVTIAGSSTGSGTAGQFTRATDMNADTSPNEFPGSFVFVTAGTANADTGFVCTVDTDFDLGTDDVTFSQFSSAGHITAGSGLDKSGNTMSVDVSDFMTNGDDNRVLTATGTDAINAEANLTFDGSTLAVTGALTTTTTATIGTDLTVTGGDISFGNGQDATITVTSTGSGTDGRDLTIRAGSAPIGSTNQNGGDLILSAGGGDGSGTSTMTFFTKKATSDLSTESMRIHTDGKVGINVNGAAPAAYLQVKGDGVYNDGLIVNEDGGSSSDFRAEGDAFTHALFVDSGANRVSIGASTNKPDALLEVTNDATNIAAPLVQFNNNDLDQVTLDINNVSGGSTNIIAVSAAGKTNGTGLSMSLSSDGTSVKGIDSEVVADLGDGGSTPTTSIAHRFTHNLPGTKSQSSIAAQGFVKKTGVTGDTKSSTIVGLKGLVSDSASNHSGSTTTLIGITSSASMSNATGTSTTFGGKFEVSGAANNYGIQVIGGSAVLGTLANAPADISTYGQLWVKDEGEGSSNTELYFTNDNGDDIRLTYSGQPNRRPVTAGGNTLALSETLAIAAGSNMSISESGGTVTFASTAASSGITGITVQEEGSSLATVGTTLNFVGSAVTATNDASNAAIKTITISAGSGGEFSESSNRIQPTSTIAANPTSIGSGEIVELQLTKKIDEHSVAVMNTGTTANSSVTAQGLGMRKNITIASPAADTGSHIYKVADTDHVILIANIKESDGKVLGSQQVRGVQLPEIDDEYVGREFTIVHHGISGTTTDLISVKPANDDAIFYAGRMWDNNQSGGDHSDVGSNLGGLGLTMGFGVFTDVQWAQLGYVAVFSITVMAVSIDQWENQHSDTVPSFGYDTDATRWIGKSGYDSPASKYAWMVTQVSGVTSPIVKKTAFVSVLGDTNEDFTPLFAPSSKS